MIQIINSDRVQFAIRRITTFACGVIIKVLAVGMHPRSPDFVRSLIIHQIDLWAKIPGTIRYLVAFDMQYVLQHATGYNLCSYCGWLEWGEKSHPYCDEQRAEAAAALEESLIRPDDFPTEE